MLLNAVLQPLCLLAFVHSILAACSELESEILVKTVPCMWWVCHKHLGQGCAF